MTRQGRMAMDKGKGEGQDIVTRERAMQRGNVRNKKGEEQRAMSRRKMKDKRG